MKISFPQNLFKKPSLFNIDNGKKVASKSKILFCGIARDVEKNLQNNINRIKFLQQYFKESKIFIYENDSIDNTKNILNSNNIIYISEKRNDSNYKDKLKNNEDKNQYNRCLVLSSCRNQYLKFIKNNYPDYDYVCVIDWDILGWSYKGFFDSIRLLYSDNIIASVSAYGVLSDYINSTTLELSPNLLMYDSFAFRPFGYYGPLTPTLHSNFNFYKFHRPTIVRSNFNGMAIYKTNLLLSCKYGVGLIDDEYVDCDHVVISDQMSNMGFYHLLNDNLIVSYSHHRFDND